MTAVYVLDDEAARDCACPRARHTHGTRDAYNRDGCRCPPCRAAHRRHEQVWRRRRAIHAWHGTSEWTTYHGTRRRLQALAAVGWTTTELAAQLGYRSPVSVSHLRSSERRTLVTTATRIAALYDALWEQKPTGGQRTRNHARKMGWAPPMAWDDDIDDPSAVPHGVVKGRRPPPEGIDEVAVQLAVDGAPSTLTAAERLEAVRRLTAAGYTQAVIAERVKLSPRAVARLAMAA